MSTWRDDFDNGVVDLQTSIPAGSISESGGKLHISIPALTDGDWTPTTRNAPIAYDTLATGDIINCETRLSAFNPDPGADNYAGIFIRLDDGNVYTFFYRNNKLSVKKFVTPSQWNLVDSGVLDGPSTTPITLKIALNNNTEELKFKYSIDDGVTWVVLFEEQYSSFTSVDVGLFVRNETPFPVSDASFDYLEVDGDGETVTSKFFACDSGGKIWEFGLPGLWWEEKTTPVSVGLYGIHGLDDSSLIMACGDNGTVIQSVDGGDTWTAMTFPDSWRLTGIWVYSATSAYVCGWNSNEGRVWHWDGVSWNLMYDNTNNGKMYGIYVESPSAIYVVQDDPWGGKGLRYYDRSKWYTGYGYNLSCESIFGAAPGEVYLHVHDAGAGNYDLKKGAADTWATEQSDPYYHLPETGLSLWVDPDGVVWMAGYVGGNQVIKSWDGNSLNVEVSISGSQFTGIWGQDENSILATANNAAGTSKHYYYNGVTWVQAYLKFALNMKTVWAAATPGPTVCGEVDDHRSQVLDLLPSQFDNSTNLRALISAIIGTPSCAATGLQEIENQGEQLLLNRWLTTAVGEQLDGLGDILDEVRETDDDEDYRAALQLKVVINTSEGDPERIIEVLKLITDAALIHYAEMWPAKIYLYAHNVHQTPELSRVQDAASAGVGVIITAVSTTNPFVFGKDKDGATPPNEFGEELPFGNGFGEVDWPDEGGDFVQVFLDNY